MEAGFAGDWTGCEILWLTASLLTLWESEFLWVSSVFVNFSSFLTSLTTCGLLFFESWLWTDEAGESFAWTESPCGLSDSFLINSLCDWLLPSNEPKPEPMPPPRNLRKLIPLIL
ncbi:hypothetical protein [Mycoplasma suis]|uniref:Uncharacterized protein n=1 Tax=Mycoplasma suis (strain Illinois) TaxID=768700 RepID=F0QS25_MYCSL|nr:hypothetical protein [Mycoplasma suis]ADX98295.1 hypothetical protein MSU_0770 [Mycoplasma suis str. Illinois]